MKSYVKFLNNVLRDNPDDYTPSVCSVGNATVTVSPHVFHALIADVSDEIRVDNKAVETHDIVKYLVPRKGVKAINVSVYTSFLKSALEHIDSETVAIEVGELSDEIRIHGEVDGVPCIVAMLLADYGAETNYDLFENLPTADEVKAIYENASPNRRRAIARFLSS